MRSARTKSRVVFDHRPPLPVNIMDKSSEHDLEKEHYMEVRYAFLEYSAYMAREVQRVQDHYDKLPPLHAKMLSTAMITRFVDLVVKLLVRCCAAG